MPGLMPMVENTGQMVGSSHPMAEISGMERMSGIGEGVGMGGIGAMGMDSMGGMTGLMTTRTGMSEVEKYLTQDQPNHYMTVSSNPFASGQWPAPNW